jgi:hypothetical protein
MPIVAGMLTIVVLGAFPRRMALELPHITATYWQFEHLCEVRSDFSQGLNTLNEVLSNISGFVFGTAIYCAMVAANTRLVGCTCHFHLVVCVETRCESGFYCVNVYCEYALTARCEHVV